VLLYCLLLSSRSARGKYSLASVKCIEKATQHIINERNADLRDFYLQKLTKFCSYQLVHIDESRCDKHIGFRRMGWSPPGVAPVEVARVYQDNRHQILPVYTQEGIL
jgi:hypothetical protein